jgi:sulfhydrogenase subunit delta
LQNKRLKIGFFSLSCCEGCELAVLDLEQRFTELLSLVEIVESRMMKQKNEKRGMDIAFVEGAVVGRDEEKKLKEIRERSTFLVSMGACASIAGVPGIRNELPPPIKEKLKKHFLKELTENVQPLDAVVKVDFKLQGCSINEEEFLTVLNQFYHQKTPLLAETPVCKECKEKENDCLLLKGIPCLGPVSYAGCNALCPSVNAQCIGCRGFTKDANFAALKELFEKMGASKEEIFNIFTFFNKWPFEGEK